MKIVSRQLRAMKITQCLLAVLRIERKYLYNNDDLSRKNSRSGLKNIKQELKKIFFPKTIFQIAGTQGK
jgi:hypothetical protein